MVVESSSNLIMRQGKAKLSFGEGTSVMRTLISKLKETTSLLDKGANPSGAVSAVAAIQAASNDGRTITIPSGTYLIDANLTINPQVIFHTGAKFQLTTGVTLTINGALTADKYQHIFECHAAARIILKQSYSVCWYGAKPDGTGNASMGIQQAIWDASNADEDGYQQNGGGQVDLPDGYYSCFDPIIYRGSSGLGLTFAGNHGTGIWSGFNNGATLEWRGTDPHFFICRAGNHTTLRDFKIVSYAGTSVERLLWVDAKNGDANKDARDAPSSGVELVRVKLSIYGDAEISDCAADCEMIAIGHPIAEGGVGSTTSQCDSIRMEDVHCLGRGTIGRVGVANGIGIMVHAPGGNVKVMGWSRVVTVGLQTGIDAYMSGHYILSDCQWGNHAGFDVIQRGGGSLIFIGGNSENGHGLLQQIGGSGMITAIINGFEWAGWQSSSGGDNSATDIIEADGYVQINGGYLSVGFQGVLGPTYAIPWIGVADARERQTTASGGAPIASHCGLSLNGVSFNQGYSDGAFNYAPIRLSGNPIYQDNGYTTEQRLRIVVENCTSHQVWDGDFQGTPIPLVAKPIGFAHLAEKTIADLAFSRINHNSIVTTGYGVTPGDGLGRTYRYDMTSSTGLDPENGTVLLGPNDVGRFKLIEPAGFYPIPGTNLRIRDLPTSDPFVIDQPWKDGNTIKISDGPTYAMVLAEALASWGMQEASGDIIDSVAGNNGVLAGTAGYEAAGPNVWLPKAITFENGYFDCGDIAALNFGTDSFTICCWVRNTNNSTNQAICGKGSDASANHFRCFLVLGYVQTLWGNPIQSYAYFPSPAAIDNWHFVAWGRNSTYGKSFVFLDGTLTETTEIVNQPMTNAMQFRIGADTGGNAYQFIGRLAGMNAYNYALREDELNALMAGP